MDNFLPKTYKKILCKSHACDISNTGHIWRHKTSRKYYQLLFGPPCRGQPRRWCKPALKNRLGFHVQKIGLLWVVHALVLGTLACPFALSSSYRALCAVM